MVIIMFAINELREKRANLFQEAKSFLDMGIDCILTNDYWNIASLLRK